MPSFTKSRAPVVLAFGVFLAGFVIAVSSGVGGPTTKLAIDDIGQAVAAFAASLSAFWQARHCTGRSRQSWLLIGAACGSWAIGQCIWSLYELNSSWHTPFPSLADIGFLLFPCLALPGLLLRPSDAFAGHGRARLVLDGLIVAASLFSISWVTVLGRVYADPAESFLGLLVGLAYPVSDLVMITIGVLVVVRARARSGLLLLISGLVGMAIADSSFSYLTAIDAYQTGSMVDFAWAAAFCLIGVAALRHDAVESAQPAVSVSAGYLVLPYFLVLAGIAIASRRIIAGNRVNLAVSALAILALLIRQLLMLIDNRELTLRVERQREELRHQAFHDALTGLANRALFFAGWATRWSCIGVICVRWPCCTATSMTSRSSTTLWATTRATPC